ncbi:methyltransferase domain-containing protein [Candidatus Hydrogenedentota bacterium]
MQTALSKKSISESFSGAADSYDRWAGPQRKIAERLIELLPHGTVATRILDIGCGTGLLTSGLIRRFPEASILGIDLAPGMVASCEERFSKSSNLKFLEADIETFSTDVRYDLLASSCTFQWLSEKEKSLNRLVSLLSQGAVFAAAILVDGTLREFRESYESAMGKPVPGLDVLSPDFFTTTLKSGGLKLHCARTEDTRMSYDNAWDTLHSFKGVGATFSNQPGYLPHGVADMRRLVREYESHHGDPDGRVPLTYRVLYCIGEKS